jgi:glycosyltransferase involved in cell wall biosynthesis
MRIAIICNQRSWGGLELFAAKWTGWLHQAGYFSVLLAPSGSKAAEFATEHKLNFEPFETKRKYADLSGIKQLGSLFVKYGISHCFISHSKDIGLVALTKCFGLYKGKSIYFQQMQLGVNKKDWLHRFFYHRLDYWIAPLPFLKQNTEQRADIASHKVHVIPFGIELAHFKPIEAEHKSSYRKRLGLPLEGVLIGSVGRFDPAKGQHLLLEAAAELINSGLDVHVLLVGEASYNEKTGYPELLNGMASSAPLQGRVHFRPFQNQIADVYKALDVFVMPSINETYGYVTIEAMASGLPVVGADAGGTAQLLLNGVTGLLFTNKQSAHLAQQLITLIQNPELMKALAANASIHAAATYSHTRMVEDVIRFIK